MITANQSEILRAANRLKEAREALLNATSLICMNESQRIHIHTMVSEIDSLFGELISGEVPKAKSRKGGRLISHTSPREAYLLGASLLSRKGK